MTGSYECTYLLRKSLLITPAIQHPGKKTAPRKLIPSLCSTG